MSSLFPNNCPCQVLQSQKAALIASSFCDLDTGRPTPLAKQWYMLCPPATTTTAAAAPTRPAPEGGGTPPSPLPSTKQMKPLAAAAACSFVVKHVACREQLEVPLAVLSGGAETSPCPPPSDAAGSADDRQRGSRLRPSPPPSSAALAAAQGLLAALGGWPAKAAEPAPEVENAGGGEGPGPIPAAEDAGLSSVAMPRPEGSMGAKQQMIVSGSPPCVPMQEPVHSSPHQIPRYDPMALNNGMHEAVAALVRVSCKMVPVAAPALPVTATAPMGTTAAAPHGHSVRNAAAGFVSDVAPQPADTAGDRKQGALSDHVTAHAAALPGTIMPGISSSAAKAATGQPIHPCRITPAGPHPEAVLSGGEPAEGSNRRLGKPTMSTGGGGGGGGGDFNFSSSVSGGGKGGEGKRRGKSQSSIKPLWPSLNNVPTKVPSKKPR